ncbi:hypothetical protein [Catellatospora tritici]|uniref:hypothetical protein n=1 Tax=Catellatospora tritici TaxID=2851566 RepID=UPI001C2D62FD|nr:hypothetical protein [Catellatospora tritici]MBV1852043.1 hypothetical protein [Catellatospora tritici]
MPAHPGRLDGGHAAAPLAALTDARRPPRTWRAWALVAGHGVLSGVATTTVVVAVFLLAEVSLRHDPRVDGPAAFGGILLITAMPGIPLGLTAGWVTGRLLGLARPGRVSLFGSCLSLLILTGAAGSAGHPGTGWLAPTSAALAAYGATALFFADWHAVVREVPPTT